MGFILVILLGSSLCARANFYDSTVVTDKETYMQGETVYVTIKLFYRASTTLDHFRVWAQYEHSSVYAYNENTLRIKYNDTHFWYNSFSFTANLGGTNIEIFAFGIDTNGSACSEATKTVFIQEKPESTVTVTVADTEGNPIQGAQVLLTDSRITDANGQAVFSVKDNIYILEITKDGYVSQRNDNLTISGKTNLNYVLVKESSTTATTPGFGFEGAIIAVIGTLLLTKVRRRPKR
jgi:hypothetical protein